MANAFSSQFVLAILTTITLELAKKGDSLINQQSDSLFVPLREESRRPVPEVKRNPGE